MSSRFILIGSKIKYNSTKKNSKIIMIQYILFLYIYGHVMVIISTCYLAFIIIKCLHKNKTSIQEHNCCLTFLHNLTLWSKYLIFQYNEQIN